VTNIGSRHPLPENIPHLTATSPGANNPAASNNGASVGAQSQPIPGSISGHPGSIGFHSRSPIKEASFLHCSTNADGSGRMGGPAAGGSTDKDTKEPSVSPPPSREGVPISR
jgi:hypothetical protein